MVRFEIRDLTSENLGVEAVCCEVENKDLQEVADEKVAWLKEMMVKGLRAKLAYEDEKPVGFIEYLPIEYAPVGVGGRNLTFIDCIWIFNPNPDKRPSGFQGKGYGRALIEDAEADAKKTSKGMAVTAYDHDFWFTPMSFFTHFGYKEVNRRGTLVLLMKTFEPVEPPSFLESKYKPQLLPGKVVVDAFWNAKCPMGLVVMRRLREVCAEFGDLVFLEEICTNERKVIDQYGRSSGIHINGEGRFWAPPSKKEIRAELKKALDKATKGTI